MLDDGCSITFVILNQIYVPDDILAMQASLRLSSSTHRVVKNVAANVTFKKSNINFIWNSK